MFMDEEMYQNFIHVTFGEHYANFLPHSDKLSANPCVFPEFIATRGGKLMLLTCIKLLISQSLLGTSGIM